MTTSTQLVIAVALLLFVYGIWCLCRISARAERAAEEMERK